MEVIKSLSTFNFKSLLMRKYLMKILLFLVPFLFIASINYWIDNAYIFRGEQTYNEIGKLIANGNNVANLTNFNEFLTYKSIVSNLKNQPNVICLGSSRSMQINKSIFPKSFFFNASVSGSSLKETISVYSLFYEKNIIPDTIIINLDPIMLSSSHDNLRDYFIDNYNTFMLKSKIGKLHDKEPSNARFYELFNPIYSYENIRYGRKKFFVTEDIFIEESVLCSDGSNVYGARMRNSNEKIILRRVQENIPKFDKFLKFAVINKELQVLFENFIHYLNEKSNVIFFLPPYNPLLAEKFTDTKYDIINKARSYFIDFAISNNIQIVGDFDPTKCKVTLQKTDFYDETHPNRDSVERIFEAFLNKNPNTYNLVDN